MSEFPLGYEKIAPATWVYLSSLLMIGLYFKFNRFWSVRNLDLFMLILLAPGLLLIQHGHDQGIRLNSELKVILQPSASEMRDQEFGESDPQLGTPNDPSTRSSTSPPSDMVEGDEVKGDEVKGGEVKGGEVVGEPVVGEAVVDDEVDRDEVITGAADDDEQQAVGSAESDDAMTQSNDRLQGTEQSELAGKIVRYRNQERNGYIFLFVVGLMWLVRVMLDTNMVRRPLLAPNLASSGLTFIGASLLVFLFANVVTGVTAEEDLFGPKSARQMVQGNGEAVTPERYKMQGPGYPLINLLPVISTTVNSDAEPGRLDAEKEHRSNVIIAKSMALFSQLAIVIGLVYIGARHFNNFSMGVGAATLYLMLPYTAQMTGRVSHALPAALIVWAVASYRRPLLSGSFLGLAMGTVYYPLFLLPLWASFYWRRGLFRFVSGFSIMVLVLGIVLAFTATSFSDYLARLSAMFGVWSPQTSGLQGIWSLGWDSIYRLPILAAFVAISITFAFWPNQKNFGTLLSCSCAIMIAVQFWHGFGGGLYMAWYLPLLLLTIFRPNLEDRVAIVVLSEPRFRLLRRPKASAPTSAAA